MNFTPLNEEAIRALIQRLPVHSATRRNTWAAIHAILHRCRRQAGWAKGIYLERGQFLFGEDELAAASYLSRQELRTVLKNLKKVGKNLVSFTTTVTTNQGSIGSVIDFDTYVPNQDFYNQQINRQSTNEQPATNHKPKDKGTKDKEKAVQEPIKSMGSCSDKSPDKDLSGREAASLLDATEKTTPPLTATATAQPENPKSTHVAQADLARLQQSPHWAFIERLTTWFYSPDCPATPDWATLSVVEQIKAMKAVDTILTRGMADAPGCEARLEKILQWVTQDGFWAVNVQAIPPLWKRKNGIYKWADLEKRMNGRPNKAKSSDELAAEFRQLLHDRREKGEDKLW